MIAIGIDPGSTGAIAAITDQQALITVRDMPYADGHVVPTQLARILRDLQLEGDLHAYVERAQAMPGMGISGCFRYGTGYGAILGVLGALDIPTNHVPPSVWKKAAGLSKDKAASRRRAMELWPDHAHRFELVKHDGRAEAALIALHGLTTRSTP